MAATVQRAASVRTMWLQSLYILPLVVVSVAFAATIDPRCLRYSNGMEAQVLPHLQDCRKFVMCDMGGYGQVMLCPPGLYFNAEEHTCSFDTVHCRNGELKDGSVEVVQPQQPQPVPIVPQQPVPEAIPDPLPVPQQPIPSIPIVPPIIVVTSPPSEQNWNPITTQPSPVVVEPQEPQLSHQHQMDLCRNQPLGVVYPVLDNCAMYVVCLGDGGAIVPHCPIGLLFDSRQKRCEFSEFAVCATPRDFVDDSVAMVEDTPGTLASVSLEEMKVLTDKERMLHQPIAQEQERVVAEDNGVRVVDNHPRCLARSDLAMTVELPHDTDCTKYLVCVGRVAIEKRCPVGQHWNALRGWCDFASQAGCKL
ncbi:uncharacterized protein LOC118467446 [Anopheles albimanus]|uniref:Chitin-binding type-2 domain-containing protein n=1 Tax=Anopheles albimanus TaxID=7167 RepID=A0A182FC11_ANOAL|nr:uncharacterized protein LOC118467446 [Anopheles albimanus]